jgi:hypothetical protein
LLTTGWMSPSFVHVHVYKCNNAHEAQEKKE